MDEFLTNNTESTKEFTDRKPIVLKHHKIKKATRTFLYNIKDWMSDIDIKSMEKIIKKKLATSSQIVTDDEGTALTFNGNHMLCIKDIAIKYSDGLLTGDSFA